MNVTLAPGTYKTTLCCKCNLKHMIWAYNTIGYGDLSTGGSFVWTSEYC